MTKRKILLLAMSLCMVAILAVGGTLAYFTAEDDATNVFTMGYVDIDLKEEFKQNSDLVPGLDINKDVWVKNTGDNDTYVRVHIAIPANMDDGNPDFNASKNFLHWNFPGASMEAGKWSFLPEYSEGTGYKGNGAGNWNYYTTSIYNKDLKKNVEYAVYVATYRTALKAGQETEIILDKVYLDATVNAVPTRDENNVVTSVIYTDTKGNKITLTPEEMNAIHVKVWAEATQVETFDNAYEALNTAFGVPGTYNPWDN